MSAIIKKRLRLIDTAGVAGLVLLLASTALAGLLPLYRDSRTAQVEAESLRGKLTQLDGLSLTLPKAETQLQQTRNRLAQAEAMLPSSGAMDQFVAQVARVAEDAGLKVNTINPRPLLDTDNYRVLPVEISGAGSWETCYQFLTGLLKMDRLTRLDNLVIHVEADNQSTGKTDLLRPTCRMSVEISTFMAR